MSETRTEKQLSIIIPVRNWDLGLLLDALTSEIDKGGCGGDLEIIIADDHSEDRYLRANRAYVRQRGDIIYYELAEQVGRAAIRNDLLARAAGRYILFLDADVLPDRSDFLRSYLACICGGNTVVCGGISYKTRILDESRYDFYRYKGVRTEWLPAEIRQAAPWRYLFTANVLIKRSILGKVGFDERFSGYGYEDIEWGIRLDREAGILHIDNSCSHLGLVEKATAFSRMRSSIPNYFLLRQLHPEVFPQAGIASPVRLLQRFPVCMLRAMDRACSILFHFSPVHAMSLFLFQLDKALLFAVAVKQATGGMGSDDDLCRARRGEG